MHIKTDVTYASLKEPFINNDAGTPPTIYYPIDIVI